MLELEDWHLSDCYFELAVCQWLAEFKSAKFRATDIQATDIRATNIRATDIRATDIRGAANIKSTNCKCS